MGWCRVWYDRGVKEEKVTSLSRALKNYVRILEISVELQVDRLRRIRALVDQAADDKNRDPLFDEIEEILREMDYDNY